MSYSKNGFLATGSGGGVGTSATIVPTARQIVIDDCSSVGTPAGITVGGSITFDGTRLARLFNGVTLYQTSNFTFNEFVAIEVLTQRISSLASGEFQIHLKRASDNAELGYISLQSDGNLVIYATSASGSGTVGAQGDRYKINLNFNGSTVDAVIRRGSFSDVGGTLALNQTGYASTTIADGTSVYLTLSTTGTAQFALHGLRVFNGPITYGADTLSGSVLQGVTYASPSMSKPQGVISRQYTFDNDNNGFVNDVGTMTVVNSRLQLASSGNNNMTALEPSATANVADGELWADIYPISADSSGQYDYGLVFRATDANNHYLLALRQGTTGSSSSEFEVYKKVAGTYTSIRGTVGVTTYNNPMALSGTTPARVMVRFVGSQISVYCNEVFVLGTTDGTYTTGRIGVRTAGSTGGVTAQFDNLSVYSLSSTWTPLAYTPQSAAAAVQYQIPTNGQINYCEVTSSANGSLTNQTWSTINNLDTIVADPNNLYNTTTKQYTVPVAGTYQINMYFRSDAAAGSNVGFAVHTSNADSPYTVWRQDSAGTGNRHTYNYSRVSKFNAGDQLRAFAYVDVAGTTVIQGAILVIQQVATSATLAAASTVPETVSTTSVGSAYSLPDPAVASISNITMTANTVFTFPTPAAGKSFTLVLSQDATGSRVPTWPSSVKWPSGNAPTVTSTANKTDVLFFLAVDAVSWLGSMGGRNY